MISNRNFSSATSERYALALYELASEESNLNNVEAEAQSIKRLLLDSKDFYNLISNPTLGKDEQLLAINKISDYCNFSKIFKNFLNFLTFKGRLFFLKNIIDNFLNLISKNKGELEASIFSAKELSNDELKKIQEDLANYIGLKIKINYNYDANLIGGLIIKLGSIMIDASVKTKLKAKKKNMVEV